MHQINQNIFSRLEENDAALQIHLHNGKHISSAQTENIRCTNQKIYAAQNGKYTLQNMKNIHCTKRKRYVAQNGKCKVHKTENTGCTKWKIYARQKRKYTLHKTENIRCTKENIRYTKENIRCTKENTDYENLNTLPGFHRFQFVDARMVSQLTLGAPNELFCKKAVLQWVFCWENCFIFPGSFLCLAGKIKYICWETI